MPQLNDIQSYALEVIDYLYFYDMAALGTFSDEKKAVYCRLLNGIDIILSQRNLGPLDSEIYKHFLLCGVEVITTEDDLHADKNDKTVRYPEKLKLVRLKSAYLSLLGEAEKYEINIEVFREDIQKLIHMSEIALAESNVSRRLVSQVLWFEFPGSIAGYVYRYFIKLNILKGGKVSQSFKDNESDRYIFLRAMLFVEFEILRKRLYFNFDIKQLTLKRYHQSAGYVEKKIAYDQKQVLFLSRNQFERIYKCDLTDRRKVEEYLLNISSSHCYNNIFLSGQAKWVSFLGAWELMYTIKTNLDKPIYNDLKNEGTCSDIASGMLKNLYGLNVSARTLYLCHRQIFDFYDFIGNTVESIEKFNVGFISPDLANIFYYHPAMPQKTLELLEQLTIQFRKNGKKMST